MTSSRASWATIMGGWALGYLALPIWLRQVDGGQNLRLLVGLVGYFAVAGAALALLGLPALPRLALRKVALPREWPFVVLPWLALQVVAQWGHVLELGHGDEEFHAGIPARLFDLLTWRTGQDLAFSWHLGAWIVLLAVIGAALLAPRLPRVAKWMALPVGLAAYYLLYSHVFAAVPQAGLDLFRYPPLDTLLRLAALLLFGVSELSLRVTGLLLALVAAWYVYRLGTLLHNDRVGVLAAIILLYTPIFMHWSLQVYLVSGQAALAAAIAYYLARHLQESDNEAAGWAFFLCGMMVLYERSAAVLLPVLLVALLAWRWWGKAPDGGVQAPALQLMARDYVKLTLLSLVTMVPWLAITRLLNVRPFVFCPRNWLDPQLAFAYPLRLLSDLTPPLFFLAALGIVLVIWQRRTWVGAFLVLWSVALYVIYTSDFPEWIPTSRFLAVLAPAWAYLAALAVDWLKPPDTPCRYWQVWYLAAGLWLTFGWVLPQRMLPGAGNDVTRWRQVNQPIETALSAAGASKTLESWLVLDLSYCSTLPFYLARHRLRPQELAVFSWYSARGKYWRTDRELWEECRKQHANVLCYAVPACLEPYEGVQEAEMLLRQLGVGLSPLFRPLVMAYGPGGSYYILEPVEKHGP